MAKLPRIISLVPQRFEDGGFSGVPRFDWELRRALPEMQSENTKLKTRAWLRWLALREPDAIVITGNETSLMVPDALRSRSELARLDGAGVLPCPGGDVQQAQSLVFGLGTLDLRAIFEAPRRTAGAGLAELGRVNPAPAHQPCASRDFGRLSHFQQGQ